MQQIIILKKEINEQLSIFFDKNQYGIIIENNSLNVIGKFNESDREIIFNIIEDVCFLNTQVFKDFKSLITVDKNIITLEILRENNNINEDIKDNAEKEINYKEFYIWLKGFLEGNERNFINKKQLNIIKKNMNINNKNTEDEYIYAKIND